MKSHVLLLCLISVSSSLAQERVAQWERMKNSDQNNDGKISRQEFRGPERMFDRLDINRDGFITRTEAESMRNRLGQGAEMPPAASMAGAMLTARIDTNGDETISLEEWTAFFSRADENQDGLMQPEEWQAAVRRQPLKDDAPALGTPAPRVKAREMNSNREVGLSNVRRPTVLVFGSHT